jgi:hypothetical protein
VSLQPTPFNRNAVIAEMGLYYARHPPLGFPRSTFASFDLKTGAVLWTMPRPLPLNPYGHLGELLFPLGHDMLFVPNLQGYVVYNVVRAEVEQVLESEPIRCTTSLQATDGTPIAVVIDVNSGALVAFGRNPDT